MSEENKQIEEYEEDMDLDEIGNIFWSLKLPVGEATEIPAPTMPGFLVHVTGATFGPKVNKNSRTVVMCTTTVENTEQTHPVCVLRENTRETIQLDLLFSESATFELKGQKVSEVTLNGYLQPPNDDGLLQNAALAEDLDDEEIQEELRRQANRKRKLAETGEDNNADDNDDDEDEEEDDEGLDADEEQTKEENTKEEDEDETEHKVPEPAAKKRKLTPKKDAATPANTPNNSSGNKKNKKDMRTLKNGIKIKDMRVGSGKTLKKGDKVTVKYVGQLENKSVFDKELSPKGFEFSLGAGDVIKGWDIGLKGMKVGGKRRIVIPPKFAYGKEGSEPSIPPNATLTFTIEVVKAN